MRKKRLLRITTVPISLVTLLKGQLKFFQENGFEVLAVSAHGPEIQKLKSEGIKHVAIGMTRQITPLRDFISLIRLIVLIVKFKPDIVHTHTPKAGLLGMLAAWICRVPTRMHTVAGLAWIETSGMKRALLMTMERVTYKCSHKIYSNSNNLRAFLEREMFFSEGKMKVIGSGSSNGIDSKYFNSSVALIEDSKKLRLKYSMGENDIAFSFVGRVVKDKGISELVEAFVELNKINPCWLFIVGAFEPELDPIPERILKMIEGCDRIIMAGHQQDVRPWLMASNVFVLPSYREGFPNVVMQAACLELPCIVSNINGCNELIQHSTSGLIVESKSVSQLKQAMEILMQDERKRKDFGMVARKFVSENFDQQFVWGELMKEYV
jgi:glycosyltransferase involved in cell wall biosynthesis